MSEPMASGDTDAPEPTPPKRRIPLVPGFLRRRAILLPTLAALFLGVDAWMIIAIEEWRDESDDLRVAAAGLGESISIVEASLEGLEAEIDLLTTQEAAAEARMVTLESEATAELEATNAYVEASLDFSECITQRLGIIRGIWERGRSSVASLEASTAATCDAAQATLDALPGAGA